MDVNLKRKNRWYDGGLAASGACCFTHPLDLLKVHLQTSGGTGKLGIVGQTVHIIRSQGALAMFNGLSASVLRNLTYSTTRFAIYGAMKEKVSPNNEPITFPTRLAMSGFSGAVGGIVGAPADMVNVRMQNDIKLPTDSAQRRNYKHAIDGLIRVIREEGFIKIFGGVEWAASRAVLLSIGQLCFYDVFKNMLLQTDYFKDNLTTHFTASLGAGAVATTLTQPFDVLKTRAMNAKPGEFKNPLQLIMFTAKEGPLTFYKGYVPAFVRLGPHTILTFIFYEQLRLRLGWLPSE